ncbi:N-lysine methyltransferase SMYD2 [Lepeophtheirus salmonis]|uniref:N-lysine methyltransferase SMYD2 n=1 Tax=Lepeophtheirus salmonis TaxID=72036 RepID=UPI001AE8CE16|nr:N-lysine methyltransferase SMYD2-like [Lepeophtheirus salmonis]
MVYKKGDEIMRCSPFSYVVKENYRDKVCDFCFSCVETKTWKCSRCCQIYYCGRECQRSSWMEIHKHECKYLYRLDSKDPPQNLLFIVRILCKLKYNGGYSKEVSMPNGGYRRFDDVAYFKDNILLDPEWKNTFFEYFSIIKTKLGGVLETNESEVLNIFTKILTNSVFMFNEKLLNFGTCISLEFSVRNHSFTPNAFYLWIGRKFVVKALCDIANFDDVRVAYKGNLGSLRQEWLQNQHIFDCNCDECTNDPFNRKDVELTCPYCPKYKHLLDGTKCTNCKKEVDSFRYYQLKERLNRLECEMLKERLAYFLKKLKFFHSFD